MKDTLGVLLAGGAGERLYPLTRDRAKPAVTFGGIYRIIDITLSNCLNSDLRRVYILTQYKALSLNRHIREGWNILGREVGEFVEVLPPMKRVSDQWYQGTADAVYQNIYSIGSEQPKHVLILSGDHIYKMDYGKMMKQHLDSAADITLATIQSRSLADLPARRGRRRQRWPRQRVSGKAEDHGPAFAAESGEGRGIDGRLSVQCRRADSRAAQGRRESAVEPRFRQRYSAQDGRRLPRLRLRLRRREQERSALLARCGHARSLLRSQHGHRFGVAHLQSVRRRVADPHAPAAVSAGEICFRRSGTHRHRARFHRLQRLHRLRGTA